jgi:hypothetical protein
MLHLRFKKCSPMISPDLKDRALKKIVDGGIDEDHTITHYASEQGWSLETSKPDISLALHGLKEIA